MAVEGIKDRFAHLIADAETIGGRAKDILAKAAADIEGLFGDDSHPAQLSIVQLLERAAHIAVSTPALQQAPAETADPTPAGQQQPAESTDSSQPAASDSSPQPTSDTPSAPSEGTSQR